MKRIIGILMMFAICPSVYSQTNQVSEEIEIHFDQNSSTLNLDLLSNKDSISQLTDLIDCLNRDTLSTITRVEIDSHASPEGGGIHNIELSKRRSDSIYEYLKSTLHLPDSTITKKHSGRDWDGLRKLVKESTMEHKDEVLHILNVVPDETWGKIAPEDKWQTLIDSRNKHLMDLRGGVPYLYMYDNFFPQLRRGSVVTIYCVVKQSKIIEEEIIINLGDEKVDAVDVIETEQLQPSDEPHPRPLFAVKSNLLQLGVGVANIGVECGVNDKFSIDFPLSYSPYTIHQNWRIRTLIVQPEFRYWLEEPFYGHFFGAHTHVGYFNVSTSNQGRFQNSADSPLWGFGVSYGYAMNIYKRLNVEFNLGLGYSNIKYDTYYNINNGALYKTNQQRDYWGITRAGVSLVYMFNLKK